MGRNHSTITQSLYLDMIEREKDLLVRVEKQGLLCYLPSFNIFSRWMLLQILLEKVIRFKIQLEIQYK